jgi:hypothetical protein
MINLLGGGGMQTQKTEMKGRGREGKGSKGKTASEKLTS